MCLGSVIGLLIGNQITPIVGAIIFSTGSAVFLYFLLREVPNVSVRVAQKQPDLIPSFRMCMRTQEFQVIKSFSFDDLYDFSFSHLFL